MRQEGPDDSRSRVNKPFFSFWMDYASDLALAKLVPRSYVDCITRSPAKSPARRITPQQQKPHVVGGHVKSQDGNSDDGKENVM
jgi:hypothetical protein